MPAVAAVVLLAGRLPGHVKPGGDVRPADPQVNGVVEQFCEFRIYLVSGKTGALDPLEDQVGSQLGGPLRKMAAPLASGAAAAVAPYERDVLCHHCRFRRALSVLHVMGTAPGPAR